jgi:hypothetical protein
MFIRAGVDSGAGHFLECQDRATMAGGEVRKGGKVGWEEGKTYQGTDQKQDIQAAHKWLDEQQVHSVLSFVLARLWSRLGVESALVSTACSPPPLLCTWLSRHQNVPSLLSGVGTKHTKPTHRVSTNYPSHIESVPKGRVPSLLSAVVTKHPKSSKVETSEGSFSPPLSFSPRC